MATQQIQITAASLRPDAVGLVYPESYLIKATNDIWGHDTMIFDNPAASRNAAYGQFVVPPDYVGSAKFTVLWSSNTATTNNIAIDIDYRCIQPENSESMDQASAQESLNTDDTNVGVVDILQSFDIGSPTASNFVAGDLCEFALIRDGSDADDTLAEAITIHYLIFEYSDV